MSMIVVGSVRSSGATTLALALAGSLERAVLIEADADGGVLALRYGLAREPGMATLAASRPGSGGGVLDHAQALPGGLPVVVARRHRGGRPICCARPVPGWLRNWPASRASTSSSTPAA